MTEDGFLHKAFLGDHVDLPVRFCRFSRRRDPDAARGGRHVPQPKLDEPADARL
jgi:hypothetical protein